MAHKSKNEAVEDLTEIRFFKWQFLRRNKTYQKDYDNYIEQFGEFTNEKERNKWDEEQGVRFLKKWGIDYPCDYRKKRPKLKPLIGEDFSIVKSMRKCRAGDESFYQNNIEYRIPHTLALEICLKYSQTQIIAMVEEIVSEAKEKREKMLSRFRRKEFEKAAKTSLYKDYLKVWDFVEKETEVKEKPKWRKLAKGFYPGDFEKKNDDTAVHRLRDRYAACAKLIKRDYVYLK